MAIDKGNLKKPVLLVVILALIVLIVFVVGTRCQTGPGESQGLKEPDSDNSIDLADSEQFDPRDYADEDIPPSDWSLAAKLYIADGPGKPAAEEKESQTSQNSQEVFTARTIPVFASILPGHLSLTTNPIIPIRPIYPFP